MSTKSLLKKPENEEKPVVEITTLLCSTGEYPLWNWSKFIKCGYIKRVEDDEIRERVLELVGPSDTVFITSPSELGDKIGTTFGWLYFIIKSFPYKELNIVLQVIDNTGKRHGFKFENKITTLTNRRTLSRIAIDIHHGWSLLELDLQKLVQKCCGAKFAELSSIRIHGNCRLLRVFTTDSYVSQDELPVEYRPCGRSGFTAARKIMTRLNA